MKKVYISKNEVIQTATSETVMTAENILLRIDKIISDNSYIYKAIEAIQTMEISGDESDQIRGEAISDTVKTREATNQQMIRLLEKMYDDLRPARSQKTEGMLKYELLMETVGKYPQDISADLVQKIAAQML